MSVVVEVGKALNTGWDAALISAVATAVTALVAFVVGVLPLLVASCQRRRQTRVFAEVVADLLSMQEVHVRSAIKVPRGKDGKVTSWEYQQICKVIALLNPRPVTELMAHSASFPKYVNKALAQCAAMLTVAQERTVFFIDVEHDTVYSIINDIPWYESVAGDICALRCALHQWMKTQPQKFDEDVEVFARNIRGVALDSEKVWRLARAKQSI